MRCKLKATFDTDARVADPLYWRYKGWVAVCGHYGIAFGFPSGDLEVDIRPGYFSGAKRLELYSYSHSSGTTPAEFDGTPILDTYSALRKLLRDAGCEYNDYGALVAWVKVDDE
jgi:hypothetical protein